jgi:tetratricopeptide (TPR) repeat protein
VLAWLCGREIGVVGSVIPRLAWAQLELGEVEQAEQVLAEAIAHLRTENARLPLAEALVVQALVARRQARWTEAEHALEEGLALARAMGYPYAEARILHDYGLLDQQQSRPEQARSHLEAAWALFQRLRARKDAAQTAQVLATLRC